MADNESGTHKAKSPLDRFLSLFTDTRGGEAPVVLLLFLNLFLILCGYYVIKVVREALILSGGGAELKSYASAFQAGVLIIFVPIYGWLSTRVGRLKLIVAVTMFFVVCLQAFALWSSASAPDLSEDATFFQSMLSLGFVFFVWVGMYSVTIIAQLWSYANDLYTRAEGERLFAVIAVGATAGAPVGSKLAGKFADWDLSIGVMLQVSAGILLLHLGIYFVVEQLIRRKRKDSAGGTESTDSEPPPLKDGNGFAMVLRNPYIRLIAVVLILLNMVNTTGEYLLGSMVEDAAKAAFAAGEVDDIGAYFVKFYGDFYTWVNIAGVLIQAFVVSRIVKHFGMRAMIFALPIVAFGVYGLAATGVGLAAMRWAKTAENATDYSVMNTTKAMLWLITTREEKYVAKQTVDTVFVRFGDMLSAGLVFVGTTWLALSIQGFAMVNLALIAIWAGVSYLLLREYRRLKATRDAEDAADTTEASDASAS